MIINTNTSNIQIRWSNKDLKEMAEISNRCAKENRAIETVLKLLEKKDKIIDLMAEFIEDELTVDEFCTKEGCYADNYIDGHCEKCLNCIKQYFENKAKEVKND